MLHIFKGKPTKYKKYLDNLNKLHTKALEKIAMKEGIDMTVFEKNLREWAEESGFKDEYINIGMDIGIEKK